MRSLEPTAPLRFQQIKFIVAVCLGYTSIGTIYRTTPTQIFNDLAYQYVSLDAPFLVCYTKQFIAKQNNSAFLRRLEHRSIHINTLHYLISSKTI